MRFSFEAKSSGETVKISVFKKYYYFCYNSETKSYYYFTFILNKVVAVKLYNFICSITEFVWYDIKQVSAHS